MVCLHVDNILLEPGCQLDGGWAVVAVAASPELDDSLLVSFRPGVKQTWLDQCVT